MANLKSGVAARTIDYLLNHGTCQGIGDRQLLERFNASGDEAAFEALVVRHGRSVLARCRGVLRDTHDAEDAFQATFLILARRAGSIWVGNSLAGWLDRVARRVAVEANQRRDRRRAIERTGLEVDTLRVDPRDPRETTSQFLYEEIDRLPEKYRVPIILCDLDGLTRDQAAGRLGWPPGTVAGRLARARVLLRTRLIRRGDFELAALMAAARTKHLAADALRTSWVRKTVQLATLSHGGSIGLSTSVSIGGAILARQVLRAMMVTSAKKVVAFSFVAALATSACVLAVGRALPESLPAQPPASAVPDQPANAGEKQPLSGTFVLPDGRPAAGVRVLFTTRDFVGDHGRIRAEAKADELGRFSIEIPPVDGPWPQWLGAGTLWAYLPGSFVATIPIYRSALPPGSKVRLKLGPSAAALFEVHDPDGKPIAGAKIEPKALDRNNAHVPDKLAELIGAETVTDARGRAVMAAFPQEEIRSIEVVTTDYGRQSFGFGFKEMSPDPKIVQLRAVGRLKGRLAGDAQAIRHCPLTVHVFAPREGTGPTLITYDTATDDEGRFEIPAIPTGSVGVRTASRCDFPWYAGLTGRLGEIKPGQTTEVVLALKPAIRVRGLVREKVTKKPIAGVPMDIAYYDARSMTTGPDGIYRGYMPPDVAFITPRTIPPRYAMTNPRQIQHRVPEISGEYTLPPYELTRGGEIRGKTVSQFAEPLVGAEVEATWRHDEGGQVPALHRLTVRTGPDGRFSIAGLPEGAEVSISARYRRLISPDSRSTVPGEAVVLHLMEPIAVAMTGRVLAPDGEPIAGALVRLRSRRPRTQVGPFADGDLVAFEDGPMLVTDAEGRFRTPPELDPNKDYAAYASAPRYMTSRTHFTAGSSATFQVIQLTPVP